MDYNERLAEFKRLLERGNAVFFGGAGVSTESGIPDFRSGTGLYATKHGGVSPERIISHSYFMAHTDDFYEYYKKAFIYPDAKPNAAHTALAKLEAAGLVKAVVTQNVDALHTHAGSRCVYELHGCIERNYCVKCGKSYPLEAITSSDGMPSGKSYPLEAVMSSDGLPSGKSYPLEAVISSDGVPKCSCGGVIKPDVVLYEEPLDETVVTGAVRAISNAKTLIIGGTSLAVYPAAGFIQYFRGDAIVLINKSETPYDSEATLVFREGIAKVFADLDV